MSTINELLSDPNNSIDTTLSIGDLKLRELTNALSKQCLEIENLKMAIRLLSKHLGVELALPVLINANDPIDLTLEYELFNDNNEE